MCDFDFDSEDESDVILIEDEDEKLERPKMYRVILHNDNYTPREFVVLILQSIFHKSQEEGRKIMLEAHTKGAGVIGVYPYDVAQTNIFLVEQLSEENSYPLRCTMEQVEL